MYDIQAQARSLCSSLAIKTIYCKNKDQGIPNMKLTISVIERCTGIPECISPYVTQDATQANKYLQALTTCIINGCPTHEWKYDKTSKHGGQSVITLM